MKACSTLLALLLFQISAVASTVIWDDDFSGSSINSYFTVYRNYGDINAVQTGGRMNFVSDRGTNFAEVHVATATDQNGNSQIGSEPVFNFFDREISIKASDPSFSGDLVSGLGYNLFLLIGVPAGGDVQNLTPRTDFSGAFARINYDVGGIWSITVGDRIIGGGVDTSTLSVTGAPSSVELVLNGGEWRLTLEGATFSGGGTSAMGSFSRLTASDLDGQSYFSMGTINQGDLDSSSVPFEVSLSRLQIADTTPIPEPSSVALFGVAALLGGSVLRQVKGKTV